MCVCLCVTKNHHFQLLSSAPEVRSDPPARALPAIGRLWPSDVDDLDGVSDDVDDVDRGDDFGRCSPGGSTDQDSLREPTLHRS